MVSDRFIKYTEFSTQSDGTCSNCPSSYGQVVFGKYLEKEMIDIGLSSVFLDTNGYVYGFIPATDGHEKDDCIGFISHMDTAPEASGENVKARIIHEYDGSDIELNKELNIWLKVSDYCDLKQYIGDDLIVTDGTTLLGADDKSGIAEILTMAEYLINHPEIEHGKISIAFTPDEEIGRGADKFSIERFGAKYAYTVDGGKIGEIEYENFNAATVILHVNGVATHPGDAKGKMKNACLIAMEYVNSMPKNEIPACTSGYEGFYHLIGFSGSIEFAKIIYNIRDHSMKLFTARKKYMKDLVASLNSIYGEGTFEIQIEDSYYNMKEIIQDNMDVVDRVIVAMKKEKIKPLIIPIRGGTDGAKLSFKGLPCPNISTGAHNYHSRFEYISIQSMEKMVRILVNIAIAG